MIRKGLVVLLSFLAAAVLVLAVMSFTGSSGRFTERLHIEMQFQCGGRVLYVTYLRRTEATWDGGSILCSLLERRIRAVGGYESVELHAEKGGSDLVLGRGYRFRVHPWVLFVVFTVYPLVFFFRGPYRRYRRRKKGLCVKCGYNLTGNISGICPECGERV